jgi:hypothetical protein
MGKWIKTENPIPVSPRIGVSQHQGPDRFLKIAFQASSGWILGNWGGNINDNSLIIPCP